MRRRCRAAAQSTAAPRRRRPVPRWRRVRADDLRNAIELRVEPLDDEPCQPPPEQATHGQGKGHQDGHLARQDRPSSAAPNPSEARMANSRSRSESVMRALLKTMPNAVTPAKATKNETMMVSVRSMVLRNEASTTDRSLIPATRGCCPSGLSGILRAVEGRSARCAPADRRLATQQRVQGIEAACRRRGLCTAR